MSSEPEALKLADKLDRDGYSCFTNDMRAAAAELRRLHAEREADRAAMREALDVLQIASAHWPFPKKREAAIEKLKARTG